MRATPNTRTGPVRRPRQRHSATLAGCASGTVPQFEWTKSRGPVTRNQYVAHTDAKPVAELATFEELNGAITTLGDLFRKYSLLLTGDSYATLVPVPQHNWEAIFELPWIVQEA